MECCPACPLTPRPIPTCCSGHLVEQAQVEARARGGVAGRPAAVRQQLGRRAPPGQVLLKHVRARLRAQLRQQRVARREQPRPACAGRRGKSLEHWWLLCACLCAQLRQQRVARREEPVRPARDVEAQFRSFVASLRVPVCPGPANSMVPSGRHPACGHARCCALHCSYAHFWAP